MRELAQNVANILKPMIETVDRFGLKAYHLRRHKDSVNGFYETLSRRDYQTDVAISYKRRFERNSGKLFTFLDYGVPWNNNNAEHANYVTTAPPTHVVIRAGLRVSNDIRGRASKQVRRISSFRNAERLRVEPPRLPQSLNVL